jgi:predicted dinucleotide-binding enzyme
VLASDERKQHKVGCRSHVVRRRDVAKKVRNADIVSAFSTVPSEVLFDVFAGKRRRRQRPSLMYCGDHQTANGIAARLIRDVGFEPVDAGPLRIARFLEPFSLAMAQLAYEGDDGPEIAYRIEHFGNSRAKKKEMS